MYGARRAMALLAGLLLSATLGAKEPASVLDVSAADASGVGQLSIRPNPDLLRRLKLRVEGVSRSQDTFSVPLPIIEPLRVELGDGAPTGVKAGGAELSGFHLRSRDRRRSPALQLVPAQGLDWNLVDARGAVWARIVDGMRSPDVARDGLRLVTADLRVGPAMAGWAGVEADGELLGNVGLRLPFAATSGVAQPKSCAAPNWPGTPGYVTDVMLVDMNRIDVLRCRPLAGVGPCDGPGGVEGEVVYVPSATLRNRIEADAADVPWYTKFSGNFAPYGNDQHPYLVWNFYRLDPDGRIEQIAHSGLKHAFATANEVCEDPTCPFNGNILGRACRDLYNAGSNDLGNALSPRAEVIPATGVWGRCGSVFDDTDNDPGDGLPGCDAVQDPGVAFDGYLHRMVVRETAIDPALHPGASFYIDAWYVVRDDIDIYNTMGHRALEPNFVAGTWRVGTLGPFHVGPVIDRWIEAATAQEVAHVGEHASAEGHVRVAARVRRLPDGRYRYDYAVMNLDFSRASVDVTTAEPNLRILSNRGFAAIDVPLLDGATVDSSEFRDGDASASNDWSAAAASGNWRWTAPPGITQDWGSLLFVRLVSPNAPGMGQVALEIAEAGTPAMLQIETLVPDGSRLFVDGFETYP